MEETLIENTLQISIIISEILLAYICYEYSRFLKRWTSLPTFKPHSLFGYLQLVRNFDGVRGIPALCYFFQYLCGICRLNSEGICLYWIFFKPYLFVYKPKFVKELICHPDAQDKSDDYRFHTPFIGLGLLSANGDHWQFHRKLISPAFRLELLREYISIFNEQAEVLLGKLKESAGQPWINISHYVEACSFDIICESTLGLKLRCQDGSEKATAYLEAVDAAKDIVIHRHFRPWTWNEFLFNFFPVGQRQAKIVKFAKEFSNKIIREKKESLLTQKNDEGGQKEIGSHPCNKKKSFLDRLLLCHLENPSFTTSDIRDEIITIITAGYETTAVTLTWALYLVGLHPNVQENIILELDGIYGNDPSRAVVYNDLNQMVYINSVIKETLRIFPTVPFIARNSRKDIQVEKYIIPKNTTIVFPFYGMYRDPEIFPDPEEFKPERFLLDNAKNIHQFSFIPFAAGTRNCLGQKFAMMEMQVILAHIFRNFKVKSLDERDKILTTYGVTLKNVNPIRICLIPRH